MADDTRQAGSGTELQAGAAGASDQGQATAAAGSLLSAPPEGTGTESGGPGVEETPWYEGLPQDLVTEKLKRYPSLEEAVRGFQNAQKKIGQKGLEAPEPGAPQAEWDAYYEALGRPESPDKYAWEEKPDGFELDEERFAAARKRLHEAGLRPEQFGTVMNLYAEELQAREEADAAKAAEEKNEAYETLKEQWGDKTEETLQQLSGFAARMGLLELFQGTALGRSAAGLQALNKMRLGMREGSPPTDQGGGDPREQIERLKQHPAYSDRRHIEHKQIMEQLSAAYKQLR